MKLSKKHVLAAMKIKGITVQDIINVLHIGKRQFYYLIEGRRSKTPSHLKKIKQMIEPEYTIILNETGGKDEQPGS